MPKIEITEKDYHLYKNRSKIKEDKKNIKKNIRTIQMKKIKNIMKLKRNLSSKNADNKIKEVLLKNQY